MGKVKSEDLRLNLIINGDAGHKEILSLQRSMKDAKLAIKTTETAMRELEKAGKASGNQYQALSAELKKNQETLSTSKARYDELTGQLSLTNKTIDELRHHIKLTRDALNEAVPNTENIIPLLLVQLYQQKNHSQIASQVADLQFVAGEGLEPPASGL